MSAAQNSQAQFSQEEINGAVEQAVAEGKTVVVENKSAQQLVAEVKRLFPEIVLLPEGKVDHKELVHKVNEIIAALNLLSTQQPVAPKQGAVRDRGPVSDRTMTDDDARKVMLGELADVPHKKAAEQLGLSYGQIYSARKGFTFKAIYQEAMKAGKNW